MRQDEEMESEDEYSERNGKNRRMEEKDIERDKGKINECVKMKRSIIGSGDQ